MGYISYVTVSIFCNVSDDRLFYQISAGPLVLTGYANLSWDSDKTSWIAHPSSIVAATVVRRGPADLRPVTTPAPSGMAQDADQRVQLTLSHAMTVHPANPRIYS